MRAILIYAVAGAAALGCGPAAPPPSGIPVVAAENFYGDLLARVGGDRVRVTSILRDPSADPHQYEASPTAAAAVADARLVVLNGVGYDDFMRKLLAASAPAGRIVIDVQELVGVGDDVNSHIWYRTGTMRSVADAAAAALARLDPANASSYAARRDAYAAGLAEIDRKVAALRTAYAGAPIAFTEAVAEYQTDAIGLVVLTPGSFMRAIEQGLDPAPADVAAMDDLIRGKRVRALLYNSQVTSPLTKSLRELAARSGVPVVGVAETIPSGFDDYREWQLAQLDDLEKALAR